MAEKKIKEQKEKQPRVRLPRTKQSSKKQRDYDLIITIVDLGHSDYVVDAAKDAGASGSTILHAKGANPHNKESFLGISLQSEKEIVLTLVKRENKKSIMNTIAIRTNLNREGNGFCFSLPVNDVVGISRMQNMERKTVKK